ncbi:MULTISPECIES: hypothetical protein [Pseudomonas]|uniref:hypothetical protein n=1 Tax=Pseudomonas TaxID=286 RepID=UPI00224A584C|nr:MULTISPECIES: hypothetical protein [unclassified Pseudomonas]MCX2888826.1 hypothetical protein [Pseudomonas sp. DCB_BI]
MGIRGTDRQIDNIECNKGGFDTFGPVRPNERRFHFIDPNGHELAVWAAQA